MNDDARSAFQSKKPQIDHALDGRPARLPACGKPAELFTSSLMRSAGFSLIEILVVVTIGAVLAVMVVLRVGGDGAQDPARQLERLAALIGNQCEQAMFQARPRGIRVTRSGYDFWQLAGDGWQRLPAEGISRPRSWPSEARPELLVDGHGARIDDDRLVPQIVCQPLGELSPFEIQLHSDGRIWRLAGRADGALMAASPPG